MPEAHVEAPTVGSVILAGLLLKLGGYGILRFLLVQSWISYFYRPLIFLICTLSILYASLMALRQIDIKRIIAYSSIAHINLAVLGLFTQTVHGSTGAIFFILSHGIVSSALFIAVGVLYQRHHSRLIYYYRGLTQVLPLFNFIIFSFIISNFGFPGTSSFVSELLILFALADSEVITFLLVLVSLLLTLIYSLLLYNKIIFGNLSSRYLRVSFDLKRQEFCSFYPLIICNILLGLAPIPIISTVHFAVERRTRGQWISATGRLLDEECDICFGQETQFDYMAPWRKEYSSEYATFYDYYEDYIPRIQDRMFTSANFVSNYRAPAWHLSIYLAVISLPPNWPQQFNFVAPTELLTRYYYIYILNQLYFVVDLHRYLQDVDWMWQSIGNEMTDEIVTTHVEVLIEHYNNPASYNVYSLRVEDWLDWLERILTPMDHERFVILMIQKSPDCQYGNVLFECYQQIARDVPPENEMSKWLINFIEG